jgi:hypothetical protein
MLRLSFHTLSLALLFVPIAARRSKLFLHRPADEPIGMILSAPLARRCQAAPHDSIFEVAGRRTITVRGDCRLIIV